MSFHYTPGEASRNTRRSRFNSVNIGDQYRRYNRGLLPLPPIEKITGTPVVPETPEVPEVVPEVPETVTPEQDGEDDVKESESKKRRITPDAEIDGQSETDTSEAVSEDVAVIKDAAVPGEGDADATEDGKESVSDGSSEQPSTTEQETVGESSTDTV